MKKPILLLLITLHFLIAAVLWAIATQPLHAQDDPCIFWDTWIGGQRFAYQVDRSGNWNLPSDISTAPGGFSGDGGGIWTFWSSSQKLQYVIVFRDWIADGQPLGQHHICVYTRK